jgi:hypothetical protein
MISDGPNMQSVETTGVPQAIDSAITSPKPSESEHKTDTVIKTDTIQVPYPVERTLTKWEQVKMDYGAIAIGGCITFVIIIIIGFIVRAYRKT